MKSIRTPLLLSAGILAASSFVTAALPAGTAVVEAAAAAETFQTTAAVNMRTSAAAASKIIVKVPKGKTVSVLEKKGTWYKASYTYKAGGKSIVKKGWMHKDYLKQYIQYKTISKIYIFTKKTANLYPSPYITSAGKAVKADNGFYTTQCITNSKGEVWYRVYLNGKKLYIKNSQLKTYAFTSFSKTAYTVQKKTSVRKSYGTDHQAVSSIPKGTLITSKKKIGNWLSVSYNGSSGYVSIKDVEELAEPIYTEKDTVIFATKNTAVYSVPDASAEKTSDIPKGNGFSSGKQAISTSGDKWYQISFQGSEGYIKAADAAEKSFTETVSKDMQAVKDTAVYASFGTMFTKLGTLSKNMAVHSSRTINGWAEISFQDSTGYVRAADLTEYVYEEPPIEETVIADTAFVSKAAAAVYPKADGKGETLFTVPVSQIVKADRLAANGWYRITWNGKTGYTAASTLEQVKTGDPMTEHEGYQFIDLRTKSKVTAKQINEYIAAYTAKVNKSSILANKGQAFITIADRYGVNALYLAAHAIHESAYGTSNISLGKNNLFGYGSYDAAAFVSSYRFDSVDACIEYIARQIKATYLNPVSWKHKGAYLGFRTNSMKNVRLDMNSEGMNFYYASDPNWGKAIAAHMERIFPYNKADYANAKVNTVYPAAPTIPAGSDLFPEGIEAQAVQSLTLYPAKGSTASAGTLAKGQTFTLLEKTNDYWVRIQYNQKEYWTNKINFVNYNKYMTVKNLGRVSGTADMLNVRKSASATSEKIGELPLNTYVCFVLKDGKPVMNSEKTWYQIKLSDGAAGWVSKAYITQELK